MNKKIKGSMIVITFAVQLLILLAMLLWVQWFLKSGTPYILKATGYDPYDFLRGRYISLTLEDNVLPLKKGEIMPQDEQIEEIKKVYVVLEKGTGNADKMEYITLHTPIDKDYIVFEDWMMLYDDNTNKIKVYPNREEYYVNEKKAPELEEKIRNTEDVYLKVRVKKGKYIVEQLIVDNIIY